MSESLEDKLNEALQAIEEAAHFCRGLGMFERRLPEDIKDACLSMAQDLDIKCKEIAPEVYCEDL